MGWSVERRRKYREPRQLADAGSCGTSGIDGKARLEAATIQTVAMRVGRV